jgi:hypothetical protein
MPGDRRSHQIRYKSHRHQLGSKSETRLGIGHMSWWEQSSRNRTMGKPRPLFNLEQLFQQRYVALT